MRMSKREKISIVMCCSDLKRVKGGMATLVSNLLACEDWGNYRITYIPTHIEQNKICKTFYFGAAYLRILFLLGSGKADLLHLHVSERGSFYRKAFLTRLAKKFGKPVILHHHGADFQQFYDSLSDKKKAYVTRILEMADQNLILSAGLEKEFLEKAPNARVTVLNNAVAVPEENRYQSGGNLIVTLGRLGERKGTYDLLAALAGIREELPADIRLCLCGDGETEAVKGWVKKLGLEDRIERIGWISGEEKEQILKKAVCHILPSYREVLPMSILETMALGIPNIATNIAAVPDLIENGVQGYLVEPGDIEAISRALLRLCSSEVLCRNMSSQAYRLMKQKFSVPVCCKRLCRIYEEVLEVC